VLCGELALQLPDHAPYRLVAPLMRGNFNASTQSVQAVVDALVHLVRHAMNAAVGVAGHTFAVRSRGDRTERQRKIYREKRRRNISILHECCQCRA
jgi:hypothetical protein